MAVHYEGTVMSAFRYRVWDNFKEATECARGAAEFNKRPFAVVRGSIGWTIPGYRSAENEVGFEEACAAEESDAKDRYELDRIEVALAAEQQADEEAEQDYLDRWTSGSGEDTIPN